ncbi:MAG: tetratricopeptide repeat protein [Halieaceae bacterium]|nr:tetratricopeptide repeat protein [Halieaceae bacterium]
MIRRKMSRWQAKPPRSSLKTGFSGLFLVVLVLSGQGCSREPTVDEHIETARALLSEAKRQMVIVRRQTKFEAIAELKAALKKDRDNVEANAILGLTLFELGEYADAASKLGSAIALGATPSTVTPKLAQALLILDEFDRLDELTLDGLGPEGRSTVQAAKALSMIYRGNMPIAVELMNAVRRSEVVSPYAEVAEARLAIETQGYAEALALLLDLLDRLPNYVPALNLLGDVQGMLGRPAEAMKAYQRVADLSEKKMAPSLNALLMRVYTGNYRRALVDLGRLQASDSRVIRNDGLRFMSGLLELQRQPYVEPRKRLMRVDSLIDYPLTLYYLAALDLEEGAPDFALSHVNQYLRFVPGGATGTKLAAKLELSLGGYTRAEYLMHRLLTRYPDEKEALALYALAQSRQAKYHEEIATLTRLLTLSPGSHSLRARLASAYLGLGAENIELADIPEIFYSGSRETPEESHAASSKANSNDQQPVVPDETAKVGGELDGDSSWRSIIAALPSRKEAPVIPYVQAEQVGRTILEKILAEYPDYEVADVLLVLNHLRRNRIEEALIAAEAYRARSPSSATAYDLLGRTLQASGREEAANAAFKNALLLRPGYPDAARGLADFERSVGDIDAAREYYRDILNHYPKNTRSGMELAGTYGEQGMTMAMLKVLEETRLADRRAVGPYLSQLRYQLALGEVEEASLIVSGMTEAQRVDLDALATIASWEITRGRYDQALANLSQLINDRPDVAQYHYLSAKAYALLGDRKRTLSELARTIELDPGHFFALIATARLELAEGDTEAFQQSLETLEKRAPDNLDVMKLSADYANSLGDSDIAQALLEKILRRHAVTDNLIALADHLLLENNSKNAESYLSAWLDEQPDDVIVREKLAEVYMHEGRAEDAMEQYRIILERIPAHVAALNNLAVLLTESDPETAIEYAEKALRFSGGASAVLDTLAMAQLKNQQVLKAERSIGRALSLSPDNANMRFHQAQIMDASGDRVGAIIALERLLQATTEFPQRQEVRAYLGSLN